jgi:hypothetical protein
MAPKKAKKRIAPVPSVSPKRVKQKRGQEVEVKVEDEEEGEAGEDEEMKKVSKVVKTEDEEGDEGDEENEQGDGDDDAVEEVKVLDEWGVAKQSVSSAAVLSHMRTYWDLLQHFSVYQSWSKELKEKEAARERARAEGRAPPPWDGNEAWRRRLQEKYAVCRIYTQTCCTHCDGQKYGHIYGDTNIDTYMDANMDTNSQVNSLLLFARSACRPPPCIC